MTLPVSTSGRDSLGSLPGERGGGSVRGGVAGYAVEPAAVDDADPGAGEYAGGVRMVLAAGAGIVADLRGPGAGVPAVVGEGGDRDTEPLAAGPAEVHGPVLAGLPGDGGAAGEGGDGAGVPAGLPGIAPLGEHPGSVDLTRPGQRREDRAVRVLPEVGGDGAVEVLHRGVRGYEHAGRGEHGVTQRLGERLAARARRLGAQPGGQPGGGAAARVAVLDAESGHPLLTRE